ncbi:MAG: DUF1385 domain-containing protein [Eubacteriales bacterium]
MSHKRKQHFSGIGGQAVLEGVMMKHKEDYAVAVRKESGEIEIQKDVFTGVFGGATIKKIPFVRGGFQLIDSMILGMKALTYSTSFYEEEEVKESKMEVLLSRVFKEKAESILMGMTITLSFVLAIGMFMILPYVLSSMLTSYTEHKLLSGIVEGMVRITIFVGYVSLISLMKDIRRLYQYHGAEHKCINCMEKGLPLTVENVMKSSKEHRRCGTSFMLLVMVISIFVFFFITVENPIYRVIYRIGLLPIIAGISYEVIRLAGKSENLLIRIISVPGMWLQHLTTKEPDASMVEVAIASVEAVFDWQEYLQEEFGE